MTVPVMYAARSLTRKAMRSATSVGWPMRPRGFSGSSRLAVHSRMGCTSAVSTLPGATPITRTLSRAQSRARVRVSMVRPAFDALYDERPTDGKKAAVLVTLMTTPPAPPLSMASLARHARYQGPVRLRSIVCRQASAEMRSLRAATGSTPALLTSTSRRPKRSRVAATRSSRAPRSVTSVGTARAEPPSASICLAPVSRSSTERAARTTPKPSAARRAAVAAPMPRLAPVTTTTRVTARVSAGDRGDGFAPRRLVDHALVVGFGGGGIVSEEALGFVLVIGVQHTRRVRPLHERAVGILGVDRHDELVVDLDHVLAVVEPPLLLGVEVGAVAGLEGDMIDPIRQPAPDRHPTPPFVGLDHHALDALEVPDGEQ